jgi:hypothetical protein
MPCTLARYFTASARQRLRGHLQADSGARWPGCELDVADMGWDILLIGPSWLTKVDQHHGGSLLPSSVIAEVLGSRRPPLSFVRNVAGPGREPVEAETRDTCRP